MPSLDVNMVLLDPDLCDTFSVLRRQTAVGQNGRSVTVPQQIDGLVGVVVMDEKAMERADDSQTVTETITVVTPFALRAASAGFQPDVVRWNGAEYLVKRAAPYRRFGEGFTKATCESTRATDRPT